MRLSSIWSQNNLFCHIFDFSILVIFLKASFKFVHEHAYPYILNQRLYQIVLLSLCGYIEPLFK